MIVIIIIIFSWSLKIAVPLFISYDIAVMTGNDLMTLTFYHLPRIWFAIHVTRATFVLTVSFLDCFVLELRKARR